MFAKELRTDHSQQPSQRTGPAQQHTTHPWLLSQDSWQLHGSSFEAPKVNNLRIVVANVNNIKGKRLKLLTTLQSRHWDTAGAPPGTAPEITDSTRLNLGPILYQQTGSSEVYQPHPRIHGGGPWVHCDWQLDHSWALEESTQEVLQVVESQLDWNQGEDNIICPWISEPESEDSPGQLHNLLRPHPEHARLLHSTWIHQDTNRHTLADPGTKA